jgi:hypothetical protein
VAGSLTVRRLPRGAAPLRRALRRLDFRIPVPAYLRRPHEPLWSDRLAAGLGLLAVALNAVLWIALWRGYDALPELVALHFNAFGEVDLIGGKNEILRLPMIGVVVWALNGAAAVAAAPSDRFLARVLLGVAAVVQVLFGAAIWRIAG